MLHNSQIFHSMMPFITLINQSVRSARMLINIKTWAGLLAIGMGLLGLAPVFFGKFPSFTDLLIAGGCFGIYKFLIPLDNIFTGPKISSDYHSLQIKSYAGEINTFRLPRYLTASHRDKELTSAHYYDLKVMLEDLPDQTREYVSRVMSDQKKITYHGLVTIIYFTIAQNESRQKIQLASIAELAKQQMLDGNFRQEPPMPVNNNIQDDTTNIEKNRRKLSINDND